TKINASVRSTVLNLRSFIVPPYESRLNSLMEVDRPHELIPVTSFDLYADRLALDGLKSQHFRKAKIFPWG
ncbi:MAG: hypothetical protein ACYC36_13805, partial [Bellilinea sp.]